MLSEKLIAVICDDVGRIYQESCDQDVASVLQSDLFQGVAQKIRVEEPELDDVKILTLILQIYSDVIRNH